MDEGVGAGGEADRIAALLLRMGPAVHYLGRADGAVPPRILGDLAGLTGSESGGLELHPDDRAAYAATCARLTAGSSEVLDYRLRSADGGWSWVRDTLRLLPDPPGPGLPAGCLVDIGGEKRAEARLEESQALMHALMEGALDAIVASDEEGRVVEFNPAAESLFGYRREEALGRSLADLIVPDRHRQRHAAGLARCRDLDAAAPMNRRLLLQAQRRDGSEFPVELTVSRARVGDRCLFVGEIRDISERAEALAEQARLTQLLHDAVASLPVGFCLFGPDDRIRLCNAAFANFYGKAPEELTGVGRDDCIEMVMRKLKGYAGRPFTFDETRREELLRNLRVVGRPPVELEMRDGRWVIVWAQATSEGGAVYVRSDITTIKQAEAAVRESDAVVRQVLEACPVPVGMTRAEDSRVIYESPASQALYGRDPAAGPAYARESFADPEDRQRYLAALRARGRVDDFQVRMRRRDGREFWAALSARLIEFRGEPVIVSSSFDLTERRQAEEEMARQREMLHQSEKLAALGELLAGVAHELNNPLSVVVGQALLLKETVADPRIAERAERIGAAADRCARIVKTFLAMARQQPRRSLAVDLNELVAAALEVTAYTLRAGDIEIALRLAPSLPPLWGDPDQLGQVLTNLLHNAEGALRGCCGPRRIEISTGFEAATGELLLTVADNGPGVPRELRRRIFEPFFTTKEVGHGTGIGLAYSHRVVEAHGGRILLREAPGGGAVFVVALPAGGGPALGAAGTGAESDGGGRRALVIDDEPDVAGVIAEVLRREGLAVEIAHDGAEALRLLRRRTYDLLLSDLRMPGLDGERLFALLRRDHPALADRVGFVTGDAMSPKARAFLARAGRPFIEKPLLPEDLRRLVRDLLDAGTAA